MPTDDRIFDQLDRLERGARVTRPARDAYHDSSTSHVTYGAPTRQYNDLGDPREAWKPDEYEFEDEPMTLDSFDEQFLRQSDHSSRQTQAALGRARMSLPSSVYEPQGRQDYGMQSHDPFQDAPSPPRFDLSHFALDQPQYDPHTSSPYHETLPSSPTPKLSHIRSAEVDRRQVARYFDHADAPELDHDMRFEPMEEAPMDSRTRDMPSRQLPTPHAIGIANTEPSGPPKNGSRAPPVVQGINLVSTRELPDRLRAVFPYPLFNAVQSKTFDTIYNTNNNFVLSAPTGSGKTAVLELAVCRLINSFRSDTYKIIYQAPTKSLCAERQRDWQAKFGPLGLQCAELTGDTDNAHLRNVQQAHIVITTPEKWDSMTRKWTDHQKLMQMVKLFLIDEVHILKEDRGATLEAVVSRMKSVGSDVRFIALSATVPNSEDIATWLGKDSMNPHIAASRERFGEEFRPVRLKKHVAGYQSDANDFGFDKTLSNKLAEIITKFSQRKPIMVFCFTRKSCVETAKLLSNWWATKSPKERYWSAPSKRLVVVDKELRDTISSGVAFHHAGITMDDRLVVEKAYLDGELSVICCTSTLAVGVNLPCHMVIIKNTVTWQGTSGCKEYSDLEIMQMLGRAGRPQFDDSAVAVIMTRLQRVAHYEKMISGQEILESCLHRNLIDHLNAEIGLGTISSASSAKKWLSGTFMYVRLKKNPDHYKFDGDASGRDLDERLEIICGKAITRLEEHDLVTATPKLRCTEFGNAMARYYVQFDTMKLIIALPPKSRVSEILSTISQAVEFKDIRFRSGEKTVYKDLNKNSSIKFPIPVNLDLPAHKVSLIIQSVMGAIELPTEDPKHSHEYMTAKAAIFHHATRLIRCIVDCQLYLEDATTTRSALMLARSIGAMVWDDSPLHMKQLEGIGLVYVRKLVNAGVTSIEELENTEPGRIERAVTRNPPFGRDVQEKAKLFPKLRISLKMVGEPVIKKEEHVSVKIKADIGFMNEKVPEVFQRRPVYVCLLAETSDGHKIHFARISAKKLSKGQEVLFSANLVDSNHTIRAYVMCDEIAGTMRNVTMKPGVPASAFPTRKTEPDVKQQSRVGTVAPKASQKRPASGRASAIVEDEFDEFEDPDLDDADFDMFGTTGFVDVDSFDNDGRSQPKSKKLKVEHTTTTDQNWQPQQLPNGKWACNHKCSDKTACKHLCCREGTDKRPKPPKPAKKHASEAVPDPKQTQLKVSTTKKPSSIKSGPSAQGAREGKLQLATKATNKCSDSKEARDLDRLHDGVKTKTTSIPKLGPGNMVAMSNAMSSRRKQPRPSFVEAARAAEDEISDYGSCDLDSNDLPNVNDLVGGKSGSHKIEPNNATNRSGCDEKGHAARIHVCDSGDDDNGVALPAASTYGDDFDFDDDEGWDFNTLQQGQLAQHKQTVPPAPNDSKEGQDEDNDHLFAGYSTDSASFDLTINRPHVVHTYGDTIDPVEDPLTVGTPARPASKAPDRPGDDNLAWFARVIGTEGFNFVD